MEVSELRLLTSKVEGRNVDGESLFFFLFFFIEVF